LQHKYYIVYRYFTTQGYWYCTLCSPI